MGRRCAKRPLQSSGNVSTDPMGSLSYFGSFVRSSTAAWEGFVTAHKRQNSFLGPICDQKGQKWPIMAPKRVQMYEQGQFFEVLGVPGWYGTCFEPPMTTWGPVWGVRDLFWGHLCVFWAILDGPEKHHCFGKGFFVHNPFFSIPLYSKPSITIF